MNWVNNLYLPEHFIYGSCCSQLEGGRELVTAFPVTGVTWRFTDSNPSLWGLGHQHSRGRPVYLSILIHWLKLQKEKIKEESLFVLNFMQISMLRLKVTWTAINILSVPRGTTSQARCCSSTHFSSLIKKALENPTATRCLSTCGFTTWRPFSEKGVTSTCLQKTIQNWHGFACGLKSSIAIPSNLRVRSTPAPGLTSQAFQQSFLAPSKLFLYLDCWWNNPIPKIENTWN